MSLVLSTKKFFVHSHMVLNFFLHAGLYKRHTKDRAEQIMQDQFHWNETQLTKISKWDLYQTLDETDSFY
jgi:hypothetical protein